MAAFQPVVKWSGSKRSQCGEIVKLFPAEIGAYYEPFCGGCSVLMALMDSGISPKRYVCSDLNGDLIALWNRIKDAPDDVLEAYTGLWKRLNADSDIARKRAFFEKQREIYNKTHDPLVFFFIMRTTTNGMPRYNRSGEFNNSFHITRDGIKPELLKPVLRMWSGKLRKNNVEFIHRPYEKALAEARGGDFVYLDPPYASTKGMYFGGIDLGAFFRSLSELNSRGVEYALSFDGKSGECDNTYSVPDWCYKRHLYLKSGNSSFKRTTGNDRNAMVYESLYLSYDAPDETPDSLF